MRVALLDVNVLIALVWPAHQHHEVAHRWFRSRGGGRWATCPLTELAFVRILSNPAFSPDALAPGEALALLEKNLAHPTRDFWADDVSAVEAVGRPYDRIEGHRQLTDAYLLSMAWSHKGILASFDAGIRRIVTKEQGSALEIIPTA